jgi:plastocyanin domain-containing protein
MKSRTILMLLATLALAGCSSKPSEVAIEVTDAGFVPQIAYLPKGKPVTIKVTRTSDATCATALVFDKSGEKYELPLNQPVTITLPAAHDDTLSYACGMNMFGGKLVAR